MTFVAPEIKGLERSYCVRKCVSLLLDYVYRYFYRVPYTVLLIKE